MGTTGKHFSDLAFSIQSQGLCANNLTPKGRQPQHIKSIGCHKILQFEPHNPFGYNNVSDANWRPPNNNIHSQNHKLHPTPRFRILRSESFRFLYWPPRSLFNFHLRDIDPSKMSRIVYFVYLLENLTVNCAGRGREIFRLNGSEL